MRTRTALLALTIVAAAQPSPDDLTRDANDAVEREDFPLAERLYEEAAGHSTDPGLIAFNRGVVLAKRGQYADAERMFRRSLDDADAPEGRRARAWFNLGNCLLKRPGGLEVSRLRTAIECYRRCLESNPDESLRIDASHNLDLAKLLWMEARGREAERDNPNDEPREMENLPDPKRPETKGKNSDSGTDPKGGGKDAKGEPRPDGSAPKEGQPKQSDQQPTPGAGKLPVLPDSDALVPLTPDEAGRYLREAAERLKKERWNQSRMASPGERPDAKNW